MISIEQPKSNGENKVSKFASKNKQLESIFSNARYMIFCINSVDIQNGKVPVMETLPFVFKY